MQRWADLSSPISAFLRTQCVIEPDAEVVRDDLFNVWKEWRMEQGMTGAATKATFGKSLVAKVVGLSERRAARRSDTAGLPLPRPHLYRGIRLKTTVEREAQE